MNEVSIPLFPLHTVLFPGGPLPLRIFEPRYIDMISQCLKEGRGFGICLIREGNEVGNAASTYEMGTLARINDWHMRHDGILGITVHGQQRFKINSQSTQPNQLLVADVEISEPEISTEVPNDLYYLVEWTKQAISQIEHRYADLPMQYHDASWLSYRVAELLPLKLTQKQYFLQLDDPLQRLERLCALMEQLDIAI